MKVYLDTIGCRLNQSEIESIARQFRVAGHTVVAIPEEADLALINTCAVTDAAASDSRQKIRQAARAGVEEIVVTGCWVSLYPEEAATLPAVSQVVPNLAKDNLVANLLQLPREAFNLGSLPRQPLPGSHQRTRAFIKVQDGCDNRCTYCVTTVARGPGHSRPVVDVLAEVHSVMYDNESNETAAKEIILTGLHLGSWGQDFSPPLHLRQLIQTILKESDIPRLRLSSLEPWDLEDEFFSMWENPRLCRHLHLPLQSGCAATLRRMARKTSPEAFATLVIGARHAIPDVAITTDLIAGFPGETEAEFAESLAFVREMQFAGGHVFTYSSRPGTAAMQMPNQVPHQLRKERNACLQATLAVSARAYQQLFLGNTLPVLWERVIPLDAQTWQLSGLTDNYLRVQASAPYSLWNQITPVLLVELSMNGIKGRINSL